MMARYISKPVEIEAMQYKEDNRDEVIAWANPIHQAIDDDGCEYDLENLRIETLEGTMMLCRGHWLIKGLKGEFYPCDPEIFAAKYRPVEEKEPKP